jgi:hypothetical protein
MSRAAKNRKKHIVSSETKSRMRESHLGKSYGAFSTEHRYKLSESHKGKIFSDATKQKMSKSVLQYNKCMTFITEYISIKEAAEKTNINNGSIARCCKNKRKTAGGFIWKQKIIL